MNWQESFFGKNYSETNLSVLINEINLRKLEFIENSLELKKGVHILDMPCGNGAISNLLASNGYQVTGIDINISFINKAKEESNNFTNKPDFICQDMKDINFINKFDAVMLLSNNFGYFDDNENFNILEKIAKSLKKEGKLLIESINREYVIQQIRLNNPILSMTPNDKVSINKNRFDLLESKLISEQITVAKGKPEKKQKIMRLYTYTEMAYFLEKIGMKIIKVYGDIDTIVYNTDSPKMIVIAQKTNTYFF